jgi:hypothetical protein
MATMNNEEDTVEKITEQKTVDDDNDVVMGVTQTTTPGLPQLTSESTLVTNECNNDATLPTVKIRQSKSLSIGTIFSSMATQMKLCPKTMDEHGTHIVYLLLKIHETLKNSNNSDISENAKRDVEFLQQAAIKRNPNSYNCLLLRIGQPDEMPTFIEQFKSDIEEGCQKSLPLDKKLHNLTGLAELYYSIWHCNSNLDYYKSKELFVIIDAKNKEVFKEVEEYDWNDRATNLQICYCICGFQLIYPETKTGEQENQLSYKYFHSINSTFILTNFEIVSAVSHNWSYWSWWKDRLVKDAQLAAFYEKVRRKLIISLKSDNPNRNLKAVREFYWFVKGLCSLPTK